MVGKNKDKERNLHQNGKGGKNRSDYRRKKLKRKSARRHSLYWGGKDEVKSDQACEGAGEKTRLYSQEEKMERGDKVGNLGMVQPVEKRRGTMWRNFLEREKKEGQAGEPKGRGRKMSHSALDDTRKSKEKKDATFREKIRGAKKFPDVVNVMVGREKTPLFHWEEDPSKRWTEQKEGNELNKNCFRK